MLPIRPFIVLFSLLIALHSPQAVAYQYAYSAPYPYYMPPGYHLAPAHNPYPYHRSYSRPRYPRPAGPARLTAPSAASVSPTPAPTPETVVPVVETASQTSAQDSGLDTRKQAFIATLLPYIEEENRRLANQRKTVAALVGRLDNSGAISANERKQLRSLARKYRVSGDPIAQVEAREELLRKIDIIPVSLALAQAVNESAWGESRFAREANNLFGIWTYDETKGLKPLRREEGKKHLVRIFDDFGDSVRYYMHTLNSHPAYSELRAIRYQLRQANSGLDGHRMAAGLEKYSAKGKDYIELIQALIRQNEWAALDSAGRRG